MKISKNNLIVIVLLYIAYIVFDVVFFEFPSGTFFYVLFMQLTFALIAISPIGAMVLRLLYGCKELTKTEREYLQPIFEEVYMSVAETNPRVNKGIQLYIDNDMNINAYATGSNTIAVTRGAYEQLSEEELKGILAHEFGHIVHGDTFLPLFLLIGNSIFLIFLLFAKLVKGCMLLLRELMPNYESLKLTCNLITIVAQIGSMAALFIIQALLLINQRANEYKADKFAYEVGYSDNLISALYQLRNFDMGHKFSILDTIKSSHPNISNRIIRLERMVS